MECSASGLVEAGSANVSHPLDNVVVRIVEFWFKHFQVSDFEARWSKWNLKGQNTISIVTNNIINYLTVPTQTENKTTIML